MGGIYFGASVAEVCLRRWYDSSTWTNGDRKFREMLDLSPTRQSAVYRCQSVLNLREHPAWEMFANIFLSSSTWNLPSRLTDRIYALRGRTRGSDLLRCKLKLLLRLTLAINFQVWWTDWGSNYLNLFHLIRIRVDSSGSVIFLRAQIPHQLKR